jgi:uncharacterized protein (TIGR02246 family)
MPEQSTTPDLAARWRQMMEALARRDFDALISFYAPDAVWDASSRGVGTFEGKAAIRRLFEEFIAPYEEFESEFEECRELGNGVVFAALRQTGRPHGSAGRVQQRSEFVSEWAEGMIVRVSVGFEAHEGRAAAERRAEERG